MLSGDICGHTLDAAFDAVRYIPHSPGGLAMHAAKSAVEQALTDLRAEHAALPVHAIIGGGNREVIPAYANINRGISARSPAGFAAAARAALAAGYRNIKIAPFDGVIAQDAGSTPIDALVQAGLDRVYAVRDAIGRDRVLMVDCHGLDEPRATALIRDIAGALPYWVECPDSNIRRSLARSRDYAVTRMSGNELRRRDDRGCGPGDGHVRGRAVRCAHAGREVRWRLSRNAGDRPGMCSA
jgi:L-alanine-DL-glutamate epimerase-like enolase superfamily enzyme